MSLDNRRSRSRAFGLWEHDRFHRLIMDLDNAKRHSDSNRTRTVTWTEVRPDPFSLLGIGGAILAATGAVVAAGHLGSPEMAVFGVALSPLVMLLPKRHVTREKVVSQRKVLERMVLGEEDLPGILSDADLVGSEMWIGWPGRRRRVDQLFRSSVGLVLVDTKTRANPIVHPGDRAQIQEYAAILQRMPRFRSQTIARYGYIRLVDSRSGKTRYVPVDQRPGA